MIFLLDSGSKQKSKPGLLTTLIRGMFALIALVAGVFIITVAATAALVVGGAVAIGAALWWQLSGKQRLASLRRSHPQRPAPANAPRRSGAVIEGELVD